MQSNTVWLEHVAGSAKSAQLRCAIPLAGKERASFTMLGSDVLSEGDICCCMCAGRVVGNSYCIKSCTMYVI